MRTPTPAERERLARLCPRGVDPDDLPDYVDLLDPADYDAEMALRRRTRERTELNDDPWRINP